MWVQDSIDFWDNDRKNVGKRLCDSVDIYDIKLFQGIKSLLGIYRKMDGKWLSDTKCI